MGASESLSSEAVEYLRSLDEAPFVALPSAADTSGKLHADFKARLIEVVGRYRLGIVVALPKEWAAAITVADKFEDFFHPLEDVPYRVLTIKSGNRRQHIILAMSPKMGNSASAIATTALLKDFPCITDVVMLGIAGGIPDPVNAEKDVRVGDVVVSSGKGLVQYDMTKIEADRIIERSIAPTPSAYLSGIVMQLEGLRAANNARPWDTHIERASSIERGIRPPTEKDVMHRVRQYRDADDPARPQGATKVHYGIIGSANSLVKKPELRDELRKAYGVLAVEMEGSGLADAAWFQGKGYLIIRGICDYCDMGKDDTWQGHAAAAAAGYMRSVIEALPAT